MSPEIQGMVALVVLFGLMMLFAAATRRWPANLRPLAAFDSLGKAIERAVEGGHRVHVSLGTGSVVGQDSAPAFAGLATLTQIAKATSMSDKPVVVTTGDGAMAILARDTLRTSYEAVGAR